MRLLSIHFPGFLLTLGGQSALAKNLSSVYPSSVLNSLVIEISFEDLVVGNRCNALERHIRYFRH